jgi:hypothetical protein
MPKAVAMSNSYIVFGDMYQNILEGLRGLLETLFGVVRVAAQPFIDYSLPKGRCCTFLPIIPAHWECLDAAGYMWNKRRII